MDAPAPSMLTPLRQGEVAPPVGAKTSRAPPPQDSHAAIDLVRLGPLIERTRGAPQVAIGLIDGPVALDHPHLAAAAVRSVSTTSVSTCSSAGSEACRHGTLVAGALVGARESGAPAICPDCTLLIRPIFLEAQSALGQVPTASVDEVAVAIVETIDAGASVLNLSVAVAEPSTRAELRMHEALDYAARRGVIVVAAAGNQGTLGSSAITRHPWVITVIACDLQGRPMADSTLSHSAGKRGLAAPGEGVVSLAPEATLQSFSGTSAATPFVTGAIALLKSLFPAAPGGQLRLAVTGPDAPRRMNLVPPLLDGLAAYQRISWRRARAAT